MTLAPGARFGSYEILAPIGVGGMGEVYRARDRALGRDVAIKILAGHLFPDAGHNARFEREARLLAALNHPHIAAIYGFERSGEILGLVLELVEGPTLQERIDADRLSLKDALTIAREIAEALEAAHAKGIVHRDLKPGNIKVAGDAGVKVLDFGLAVAVASAADAQLATVSVTAVGVVAGTAPYMSPEQARGEAIDTRTDIWAFGCILYEMLSGRLAFRGPTVSDTVVSILTRDPDWSALPPDLPVSVNRLLRRCLAKDARMRLHSLADARLDLDEALSSAADHTAVADAAPGALAARRGMKLWQPAALAAGALILLGVGYTAGTRFAAQPSAPAGSQVFGVDEPPGETIYRFADPVSISPDGRRMTLITNAADGRSQMWIRSLDSIAPELVDGSQGAIFPFWSPDSRTVTFSAQGQLHAFDLTNRSLRAVSNTTGVSLGAGAWNRDGVLVFARGIGQGLGMIPAGGGDMRPLTTPDKSGAELFHGFPQFLPDQRRFLFYAMNQQPGAQSSVMVGDLTSQTVKRVLGTDTKAIYVKPGYLLYGRGGELVAQRFDADRAEVVGDPVVVANRLWSGVNAFSASDNGTIAFVTRRTPITRLTWIDRSGRLLGTVGDPSEWVHIAVSPDERRIAAERLDPKTGMGSIWLLSLAQNVFTRFIPGAEYNFAPTWSHDGSRIAFAATRRRGIADLYVKAIDSSEDQPAFISNELMQPNDLLPDGTLVFSRGSANGMGLWSIPLGAKQEPTQIVKAAGTQTAGKISPDGRWLAYVSNESGRREVYVRSYPVGGGRTQVSAGGGNQPRWRRDGKEVFFLADDGSIMAAAVTTGATFSAEPPQALAVRTEPDITGGRFTYDVADMGRKFLVNRAFGADLAPAVTVILNWQARLGR